MLSFLLRINNRIRGLEKPLRKGMICNRQAHNTACLKQDALKHSKTMAGDKGIHGNNEKKKKNRIFIHSFGFCLLSCVFKSGLENRVSSSGKESNSLQQELKCVCGDLGKTRHFSV